MGQIISKAQLTFTDLYDSYSVVLNPEVVPVECDQDGITSSDAATTIKFTGKFGVKDTTVNCTQKTFVGDPRVSVAIDNTNKTITIKPVKGKTLPNDAEIGFEFVTTDANKFTFYKEVALIKLNRGKSNVTFKIYSENGDTFTEGVEEIQMETVGYDGDVQINPSGDNVKYQWDQYNPQTKSWTHNLTDKSTLTVQKKDVIDSNIYRCTMVYTKGNGDITTCEDYFVLKLFNNQYTASVGYFYGDNVFSRSEPFVVVYAELYRDGKPVETLATKKCYYHPDNRYNATTQQRTAFNGEGITESYKTDGQLMYMIYQVEQKVHSADPDYHIMLYKYNSQSSSVHKWDPVYNNSSYVYRNNMYNTSTNIHDYTNIIAISKNDVTRSADINIDVYTKVVDNSGYYTFDNDLLLCHTNANVIDLHDPVVSDTKPDSPRDGQLWLNTNAKPPKLMVYDKEAEEWTNVIQTEGKNIYTSKPNVYVEGDLWVLGPGEEIELYIKSISSWEVFKEGSTLIAMVSNDRFEYDDWEDAAPYISDFTDMKNNIEQHMNFLPNKGLQIFTLDSDNKKDYYVQIDSKEIGFYDNTGTDGEVKVVYINGQQAYIQKLKVVDDATFGDIATFNSDIFIQDTNTAWGFNFQIEDNGSLSLVAKN